MKYIFYSLIILFFSTNTLFAQLVTTYFPHGAIKAQTHYIEGTYSDKKVGIKDGLEEVYYEMGTLAYKVNYVNNKRDGVLVWFDQKRKKLADMFYKNGKLEGYDTSYFTNGKVKHKILYKNDMKEGLQKEYFHNGILALEVLYIHNKKEGLQKEYTPNAKLYSEVFYKNNYKEGKQKWFDKNGKVIKTIYNKMDRPVNIMKKIQEKKEKKNILINSIDFSLQKVK